MFDRYYIFCFCVCMLSIQLASYGYTILKQDQTDEIISTREPQVQGSDLNSKRLSICTTWTGVIVTYNNGIVESRDSIFELTLNRDSTFSLQIKRGYFCGSWSFRESRGSYSLVLECDRTDFPYYTYLSVSVKDWGLQLHSIVNRPHFIGVNWKLRQKLAANGG